MLTTAYYDMLFVDHSVSLGKLVGGFSYCDPYISTRFFPCLRESKNILTNLFVLKHNSDIVSSFQVLEAMRNDQILTPCCHELMALETFALRSDFITHLGLHWKMFAIAALMMPYRGDDGTLLVPFMCQEATSSKRSLRLGNYGMPWEDFHFLGVKF